MAEFFIFISLVMLHSLIGLLKFHTATLSSVLSGPGISPGIYKIPKAEVFNNIITCTKKHARSSASCVIFGKKKIKSFIFLADLPFFNYTQYLLIGVL